MFIVYSLLNGVNKKGIELSSIPFLYDVRYYDYLINVTLPW